MKRMSLLRNGLGAALLLFSLTACEDDDEMMQESKARVMVVHASPDAPAVDLLVDNVKVNATALSYPNNTGYLEVASGTRNFKVNAAGTTTTVINADVPLMENAAYSVFAFDRVAQIKPLVVMDNLGAHRPKRIRELIEAREAVRMQSRYRTARTRDNFSYSPRCR